ncbi:hypothetical protein EDB81DRAFT_791532, partial [Dactylonectria macrodidyma]
MAALFALKKTNKMKRTKMVGEPELYFRRSRTGCLTCRAIRIKCDEKRPQCQNCHDRGVACDGFTKKLKWVSVGFEPHMVSPPETQRDTRTATTAGSALALVPARFSLQPSLTSGLALASPRDAYLLSHWAETFIGLVFPNPYNAVDFRAANLSMFMDGDSALFRTSLASSATHLAAIGSISEAEALETQHMALRAVNTSIRCSKPTPGQGGRPVYLSDDCISASQNLAGVAVIQGYDLSKVLVHVQGSVSILQARCDWDRAAGLSDSLVKSPILCPTVKFLAYFDVFCTVPSPRRPLLTRSFWDKHIFPSLDPDMVSNRRPDVAHGYASQIFCILGESSGLICDLFEGLIDDDTFFSQREMILESLRYAMNRIPAAKYHAEALAGTRFHDESWETINDNACIAAAMSHGLATEIFLHRAHASDPAILARLSGRLYNAVLGVPLDSSCMTLMAWPLFVLGCESASASTRATQVTQLLQGMVKKMNILNISRCFDVLRDVIWPLGSHMQNKEGRPDEGSSCVLMQTDWVYYCWRERVELCL